MIQCAACTHFTLRDVGAMASRGCGHCEHDAKHSYYPALADRECSQFEAASQATTDKRKEWLAR